MLKQRQKWMRQDPERDIYGDCVRTAFACLLDLDRDDVPNFQHGYACGAGEEVHAVLAKVREWLRPQGLGLVWQELNTPDVQTVLDWMRETNPAERWLLYGGTEHEMTNHLVCCRGGEIEWNTCRNADIVGGHWPERERLSMALITKRLED